ncbi:hypothetical protein [Microtetraspora sp. NBRC 16547]|uniref:hypothetical protein n=1 Tax=Microtetraspora sp. NBRC 16547 TaxID=3030993 RepID=UPI0024A24D4E|nr:hypothetical protein [Microtetraspora sp. NBRC 16547]GLX01691.1 hypothetical protein Misp02_57770 [Microtetraspora sp. NBRC 16547]
MIELLGAMISLAAVTVLGLIALLLISLCVLVGLAALAASTRRETYERVEAGRDQAAGASATRERLVRYGAPARPDPVRGHGSP